MKEIENTVLAMTEWLDEQHADCYITIITKNDNTFCVAYADETIKLISSLVAGMVKYPALNDILTEAVNLYTAIKEQS